MNESAIAAEGLNKSFGRKKVLADVNLIVPKGEFHVIFGPNGAGKTTLLRVLAGILKPDSGKIRILGRDISEDASIRKQIGLVSHNTYLYENLTVNENLGFFCRLYGMDRIGERIVELSRRFGLDEFNEKPVRTLSRGMKQRASIARALLQEPDILLLDEPYTGLDHSTSVKFTSYLKKIHGDGMTIVMTTHNLSFGYSVAGSFSIVRKGKVRYEGLKADISLDALEEIAVGL